MNPVLRKAGLQVLFWFVVIAFLFLFNQQAQLALLIGAIFWALRSPYHSIQSLTVALLATMYNDGTTPIWGEPVGSNPVVTALRLLILVVVLLRVVLERFRRLDHPPDIVLGRTALLAGAVGVCALIASPLLDVSLFKLALFTIGLVGVALASAFAAQDRRDDLFLWIWSWFAAIIVASAPLLVLPIGYAVNHTGFQGWIAQPQAAGLMFAPMVLFFGGLGLFDRLWPRLNVGLGALALLETFASLSRNAILAVAIGIAFGVFVSYRRDPRRWSVLTFVGMAAALLLLILPQTQNFIGSIAAKGGAGSAFSQESAFERSRGALVDASLANFARYPLTGAGFGIATDPHTMVVQRDPIVGLPISAPSEKGVTWVAMLEEIGLIGTFFFILLMIPIFRSALRNRSATAFAVAVTVLMTGNGEAAIFSFGGLGLFMWLLMLFAHGDGRPHDG